MSARQQLYVGAYVRIADLTHPEDEPSLRIGDEGIVVDIYQHPKHGAIPTVRFFGRNEGFECALLLYKGDACEVIEKTAVAS